MALSRSSINLILGIIVAALAITAVTAIYLNPSQPEIRSQTAEAQVPEKSPPVDLPNRVAALEQMAAREPQNSEYPAQIGNLYYDAGEYSKAVDYYRQSLKIRPRDPSVETDLATCFHYLGQEDRALEILDNVLSYSPGFTQAKFNKGIVLIEGKKDVKDGIAVWEDLLRSDPNYGQRAQLEQKIRQLKESAQ
jgi:cytochrome c-type biogenesis protein CcmH/NrfG